MNAATSGGVTALMNAALKGHVDVAKFLIDSGQYLI